MREEEEDKKKKKEELEQIKVKFDSAKVEEADARDRRKLLNANLKEKQAELHYYEVNAEKEKKQEKKLLKEIEV